MHPLTVGRLRLSAVVERAGPTPLHWLLPDVTPAQLERHREWLAPHFLDAKGRLLQSIHAFVIQAPGLTAVVDTCVGNDKDRGGRAPFHMMRTSFLDDMTAAGFPPEAIDVVICTHLHVDHVGWNTRLENGTWIPTFPRARHLFARTEWEHSSTEDDDDTKRIMGDSVRPVLEGRGLSVSNVKFESYPGIADGIIIRQFPLRGAPVSGRDAITVVVSRQEEGAIIEQPAAAPPTTTR